MNQRRIRYGGLKAKRTSSVTSTLPDQIEISGLSIEGRGTARIDGKLIFISGALPNETVSARLEKSGKRFDEAAVNEIFTASENRVTPICKHYENCGGCDLQHLETLKAVELKQEQILSILERQANITPTVVDAPLLSTKTSGYRRSARVGINQRENGELLIGFRRAASNKLVNIDQCPVLTERMNEFLKGLRETLTPFDKLKMLTHIELVDGDTGLNVEIRATKGLSDELRLALTELAKSAQTNLRIALDSQTVELNRCFEPSYQLNEQSLNLEFDTTDFLQVNAEINQQMINRALEWLKPRDTDQVLDLFSGLGNFSLPLAQICAGVTAVEGSAKMVERSLSNARLNGIDNIEAYKADLSQVTPSVHWLKRAYDLIVIDPPRTGAAAIIPALEQQKPRALIYVACDPMSLVRDSQVLVSQGYKLSRLAVADMFPQTHHIETLALFEANR